MGKLSKRQQRRIKYFLKAKAELKKKKDLIHSGDAPGYISRHVPVIRRLAPNIDLLLIVASFVKPPLKTGLIDRFLVLAELEELNAMICLNKIDLLRDKQEAEEIATLYQDIGYPVILTSVPLKIGTEQLFKNLQGKYSALAGHSGVGKTSLLNTFAPQLKLEVNEISKATGKGRHTTTRVRIYELDESTRILDLPGIKELDFIDIHPSEARLFYREFLRYAPLCKFSDCTHTHEIKCAVKEALQKGEIHPLRYKSYLQFVESLQNI